jgi:hypothetical protein
LLLCRLRELQFSPSGRGVLRRPLVRRDCFEVFSVLKVERERRPCSVRRKSLLLAYGLRLDLWARHGRPGLAVDQFVNRANNAADFKSSSTSPSFLRMMLWMCGTFNLTVGAASGRPANRRYSESQNGIPARGWAK